MEVSKEIFFCFTYALIKLISHQKLYKSLVNSFQDMVDLNEKERSFSAKLKLHIMLNLKI